MVFKTFTRSNQYGLISLVVSLPVVAIATGIIAAINLVGSDEPWLTWISLLLGSMFGLFLSVVIAVHLDEGLVPDHLFGIGVMFFPIAVVGGIFTAVIVIFSPHAATAWSVYAAMLIVYLLNGWFTYMFVCKNEQALKRVAHKNELSYSWREKRRGRRDAHTRHLRR